MTPVQLGKYTIFVARMRMEGTGINRMACREVERSNLVTLDWMELQVSFFGLFVVRDCGGFFGATGIVQRPLVRLRCTVMIIFSSFIILTLHFDENSCKVIISEIYNRYD